MIARLRRLWRRLFTGRQGQTSIDTTTDALWWSEWEGQ